MKSTRALRRFLAALLVFVAVPAAAPPIAKADLIDDFAWVLDKVPGVFPISGQDIRDSRAFFEDLANVKSDTDVGNLLQKHKDSPLGQQATSAIGGVPSWFWDLIDLYIAFRTDDFWGVVAKLGEAAICIVAQVMTGGAVDVCGLIEELVAVGKALLDAATAVAEFFQSLGEGAWEAAKAIGCSLGLGGCGESSPPEQRAYAWVFAPKVPAGLAAKKAVDPFAFNYLLKQLEADASAKPAKLHIQTPPTWLKEYYSPAVVQTASQVFAKVVESQWSADMAKNVAPQLSKKRSEYDNPQQVAQLAGLAAAAHAKNKAVDPYQEVAKRCADDFVKGFGFAHVDRWIALFPGEAKGLGGLKSNQEWCAGVFRPKNKGNIAEHFRTFAQANYCPPYGQSLLCPTLAAYQSCLGLMGSVGEKGQCGVDVTAAGIEAAKKIDAEFKAKGSKIPCEIKASGLKGGTKPVDFVCRRPTQGKACEDFYQMFFGTLPAKLVNCTVVKEKPYEDLEALVAQAASSLQGEYGLPFGIDPVDPLIVRASSPEVVGKVKDKNPSFGFKSPSAKPGFDYFLFQFPRPIDGLSTPGLGMELKLPAATQTVQMNKLQEKLDIVKPGDPDPMGTPSVGTGSLTPSAAATSVAVPGAALTGARGSMQTMSGSAPAGGGPGSAASAGGLAPKGPDLGGMPAPAPTQGKVPSAGSGAAAPGGSDGAAKAVAGVPPSITPPKPASPGAPAPAPMQGAAPPAGERQPPPVARLSPVADIRSDLRVTVAGKYPVLWGQAVTIPDADARRAQNGICEVAIRHDAKNTGTAASGPFARRWVNLQNPAPVTDTYPSIPAGGSEPRTDTLPLKPGPNRLTLTLDYLNQVKEGNDANNTYALTVTVTGSCGMPPPAAPTAPGRGVLPAPAPPTRLPAVRQPQVAPNPNQPRLAPQGR